jgi:ribonuclease D
MDTLATPPSPELVSRPADLARVLEAAARAPRIALDVEASGMHAYRARPCTVQIAWDGGRAVAVVDLLALPMAALSPLLGPGGPCKIIHDVAFDARLLAEAGVAIGAVHDTSVAARMLGRTATGLASLLASELGLAIDKSMQRHDWRIRPIDPAMMAYLQEDVQHLEALERALWAEVEGRGIEDAVLEETRYRVDCAAQAAREPEAPSYLRLKGADRLSPRELAALRAIFALREAEAERRDVPPHRVIAHEGLLALANARPRTARDVAKVRGVPGDPGSQALREAVAAALAAAPDALLPEEMPSRRERPPPAVLQARRGREARLLAWRRDEAKKRGVDEQVVLPGHCLKDAADLDDPTLDRLSQIAGIGAFRLRADGGAIVAALQAPEAPAP